MSFTMGLPLCPTPVYMQVPWRNQMITPAMQGFTDAAMAPDGQGNNPKWAVQMAPWRLRPRISELKMIQDQHPFQVLKIPREQNGTAHCLAAQAKSRHITLPSSFSCSSGTHGACCPVLAVLRTVTWGSLNLVIVLCF
ncbi:unnamed protein product [Urochloa decumbens]|uniref:Uncharacterized protein n=1 Tax=Urochloa decumbens TaxID=240449 RepID=A0ABC9C3K6_9POAL